MNNFRGKTQKVLLQTTISWCTFNNICLPEPFLSRLLPLARIRNALLTSEKIALGRGATTWLQNTHCLHKEEPIYTMCGLEGQSSWMSMGNKTHPGRIAQTAAGRGIKIFFWTRCFGKSYTALRRFPWTRHTSLLASAPTMGSQNRFFKRGHFNNLKHNQSHQVFHPQSSSISNPVSFCIVAGQNSPS